MTDAVAPLRLRGVVKHFDDVGAVAGVDLDLGPGELLALVGPSGCGKSTLLRSIAGLLPIDAGTIHIAGLLVDDGSHQVPPERRPTGLVFQEHALFPHLSVADNVGFGLRDLDSAASRSPASTTTCASSCGTTSPRRSRRPARRRCS